MRASPSLRSAFAQWSALVAVAAAVVVVAAWLERPATAVVPGVNGKIAFWSDQSGNEEIYVMNADGTGRTNITINTANDVGPAWSPRGTKIAFSSDREGNYEIYVMNADGTGQTRLTNAVGDDHSPSWSPDGTKIAFSSKRDGNRQIYVMNADGTGQTRLTTNSANDNHPSWSPDGTQIAFSSDRDGNDVRQIYVMDADGTGQTNISNSTNVFAFDQHPAWSPDGTQIAFERAQKIGSLFVDIYLMNTDGTGQTNITANSGANEYLPAWSPDGTMIAFSRSVNLNEFRLYVMNSNGTGPTDISNNAVRDIEADWGVRPLMPAVMIEDLSELVESYNLPYGTENALLVNLNTALAALSGGDTEQARKSLQAFINQVEARRGKKLTAEQAGVLVEAAEAILAALE